MTLRQLGGACCSVGSVGNFMDFQTLMLFSLLTHTCENKRQFSMHYHLSLFHTKLTSLSHCLITTSGKTLEN